jgi:hypothetical protein
MPGAASGQGDMIYQGEAIACEKKNRSMRLLILFEAESEEIGLWSEQIRMEVGLHCLGQLLGAQRLF